MLAANGHTPNNNDGNSGYSASHASADVCHMSRLGSCSSETQ